jgi:hypothetical protein
LEAWGIHARTHARTHAYTHTHTHTTQLGEKDKMVPAVPSRIRTPPLRMPRDIRLAYAVCRSCWARLCYACPSSVEPLPYASVRIPRLCYACKRHTSCVCRMPLCAYRASVTHAPLAVNLVSDL